MGVGGWDLHPGALSGVTDWQWPTSGLRRYKPQFQVSAHNWWKSSWQNF